METSKSAEILLVEDNPNDIELMLRVLKKNGLADSVHISTDGEQALDFLTGPGAQRAKRTSLKVIFLDLKLPKVDGLEVLRSIKSDAETKLIPVVVLTSSQEEKDIAESYRLGANSYIVKPVSFEKFAEAVSEMGLYWLQLNKTAR